MKKLAILLSVLALCVPVANAASVAVDLGTAGSFGALAGSGITNAVAGTIINGNVGSHPTPAVSGLESADVNGILYLAAGAVVGQAKTDLLAAYAAAEAVVSDGNSDEPANLSGRILEPNVYTFSTAVSFSAGNLTLDADGNSNAMWLFQLPSTLLTAADFNVLLINDADANNVFWQVGSSATIGIRNNFVGNILADQSITLNGTGTLNGRALAKDGAVTISGIMTISVPSFAPSPPTVPNVVGQTQANAGTAITDVGLVVGAITNAYSDTVAAGLVISQNPVGGTEVAGGTDVNILVSFGLPLIPDVVGQAQADANTAITEASFAVGTITNDYSETVAAGLVISQNPVGGTARVSGTSVNIVVSLGSSLILIPDVVGQAQADANTAIIAASFTVGAITTNYSDTVAAGLVISQNPAAGTTAASGTDVNMVVSLGPPLIPDVVGQAQADANTAIIAASFTVGAITTNYSDTVAAGLVISQNPAAGTAAASGTDVDIVVSLGPPLNKVVLVYKLSMAINPVIEYADANGLEADVSKENLSAYVVFGVDNAYGVDAVSGANGPTVVLFGKDGTTKFQKTLGGDEPNSFVNIWIFGDVNSINPFEVTNVNNAVATSTGIEFGDSNATTGFNIETSLYGKNTTQDIGQTEKLSVAKSLKGQAWIDRQFVEGWGAASATLDSKLTKDANKNNRTVATTVANIETTVLRIYTPVSVLP